MKQLLWVLLCFPLLLQAQSKKEKKAAAARQQAQQEAVSRIKTHVQFLAGDELQGRKAGTTGEQMARDYIVTEFTNLGLQPKGNDGFVQTFLIEEGKKIDTATYFSINDKKLLVSKEFFPLPYSANKSASGSPALDLREAGEPWFADLKEWVDNKAFANGDLHQLIIKEATRVASKGAAALILYNSAPNAANITFNKFDSTPVVTIPVVYMPVESFKKYCNDAAAIYNINMNVSVKYAKSYGSNVVGYINNEAPTTVVLGAHYDHLGTSTKNFGDSIYNGADDNASGTAGLIEIARALKNSGSKKNNFLFIAFSAGEIDRLGSKYWLENPVGISNINYMVNFDMIGRYDDSRSLTVGGAGTSALWSKLLMAANDNSVRIKIDTTTIGQGDHTSFISKEIPSLYFFTGSHSDYRQPTDEADKLNVEGEYKIISFVQRVLETADAQGKIAFSKPLVPVPATGVRFTVSLGVIPDNTYKGKGFKIGGVTPKRLADKIGLKAGDILLQLGDYEIKEMNSYTQVLSMFKQGDTTRLKVLRGSDEKSVEVQFQ
ncbi:MAG: M28 family peptidase [Chitinophagaceae bacterium]|nr:M28 family peptidase [Chitinophagaceae bacterium]